MISEDFVVSGILIQFINLTDNSESSSGPSEQNPEPQSAKMLIFLQNGEQRLITFTLPKESCTLQEVLEQVCCGYFALVVQFAKLQALFAKFIIFV